MVLGGDCYTDGTSLGATRLFERINYLFNNNWLHDIRLDRAIFRELYSWLKENIEEE